MMGGGMLQQGGGMFQQGGGGLGFNPIDPLGVLGGGGRRNQGRNPNRPGMNTGPGYLYDGPNSGQYQQYPPTMPNRPNVTPSGGYIYNPSTGQYEYPAGGGAQPPAAQPAAAAQPRQVYDPSDPQRRIYIEGSNPRQYTGYYVNEANQTVPIPAATVASNPPPAKPPARATGSPSGSPATNLDPLPDTLHADGPTENTVVTRIKPASGPQRQRLFQEVEGRIIDILRSDLNTLLKPFYWSISDQERALELARLKRAGNDKIGSLARAIDSKDPLLTASCFEDAGVAPADSEPLVRRLALLKILREIQKNRPRDAFEMDDMAQRLTNAAIQAGADEERVRPVTGQLVSLAQLRDTLRALVGEGAEPGIALGIVRPDAVFKVIRSPSFVGTPVALDAETLLAPVTSRGAGGGKLTIGETSAAQIGLPILGASGPPVPEAKAAAAAPSGLTFTLPPDAGADLTLWVLKSDGVQFTQLTLKPGTAETIPNRTKAQICYLDGKSPSPTPWRELPVGSFEFQRPRGSGTWQLFSKPFPVILDNTANAFPFAYRIDGQPATVQPRQSITLSRTSPTTTIEFARGNNQVASRLLLPGKTRYAVRLDGDSQGIDLFKAEEPLPEADAAVVTASANVPTAPGPAPEPPRAAQQPDELRSRYPVGELQD
jgi:hypothetical protein